MNTASIVIIIIIAVLFIAVAVIIKKKKLISSCGENCACCGATKCQRRKSSIDIKDDSDI